MEVTKVVKLRKGKQLMVFVYVDDVINWIIDWSDEDIEKEIYKKIFNETADNIIQYNTNNNESKDIDTLSYSLEKYIEKYKGEK